MASPKTKPFLSEQLLSGSQGWSKLERVAYMATPDTDAFWAEKVEAMSSSALQAYVHEVRHGQTVSQNFRSAITVDGDFQPEKSSVLTFHLHPELEKKFRMFKHELEKERKEPLTFEDVLDALLEGKSFASAKMHIQICPNCIEQLGRPREPRYNPTAIS